MIDWDKRRQRKADVTARAAQPNHMYTYCRIMGCPDTAKAGTGKGLDTRYCRKHADHYSRHGDPLKGNYPAAVINPYRRAALKWLQENREEFWVNNAVSRVKGLYRRAGPHIEAFRLRGKTPRERAWAAWARLRKHEVDPMLPLAAWLGLEAVITGDPQAVRKAEYKRVQAAKLVHRMVSGSHRRWEQEFKDPNNPFGTFKHVEELHVYPQSRGVVLRYMGKDLEVAVEHIVEPILDHAHQPAQDSGKQTARPYPKGVIGRRRKADEAE